MRANSFSPSTALRWNHRWGALILTATLGLVLGACSDSGGSGGGSGDGTLIFEFSNVAGQTSLPLNREILFKFSQPVDLSTVTFETVTFRNLTNSEPVTGVFRLDRNDPTLVRFIPTFPTREDFSDSGLKEGNEYEVRLTTAGGAGQTVRSLRGRPLAVGGSVRFSMINIDANTPLSDIFDDPVAGPPQVVGTTPLNGATNTGLNLFSQEPLLIEVFFNQPLLPTADNINTQTIFLWDTFRQRLVPTTPILARNDLEETRIRLEPGGILPADTELEVRFANSLRDIIGEGNSAIDGVNFATGFRTEAAPPGQDGFPDTFSEGFENKSLHDPRGMIDGFAIAEWSSNGVRALKAGRPFPGTGELGFFRLNFNESVLFDTDSQLLLTENGVVTVNGGVFNFTEFIMEEGSRITVQGSNPLYIYATKAIRIAQNATINASGQAGRSVFSVPNLGGQITNGGSAGPAGGDGGDGSPQNSGQTGIQSVNGGDPGNGPFQAEGAGGQGGKAAGPPGDSSDPTGSGGGGGSHLTQGRNRNNRTRDNNGCLQADGEPGAKGTSPGIAGGVRFQDPDQTNNFYGRGGELTLADAGGGQGGGGGGDQLGPPVPPASSNTDDSGGGGGGGGGMVYLAALGNLIVEENAHIDCSGGAGGGGSNNAESKWGGGGGGGAGGTIILHSLSTISVSGILNVGGGFTSGDITGDQPGQVSNNRFVGGWGGSGVIQVEGPTRQIAGAVLVPTQSDITGAEFNEDPEWYVDLDDCAALSCQPHECNNRTPMPLSRDLNEFSNLSSARSGWIFTGETDRRGPGWPHYEFNGVDANGVVQTDAAGNILDTTHFAIDTDIEGKVREDFIAPNTRVTFEWQGADELEPRGTGKPDLNTIVPGPDTWTTDISQINGKRFVRFRVKFNTAVDGQVSLNAPRPLIDRLDFGIRF